tara:strand:+ start:2285 stop:3565 length:1281 start_codon:yes stop_codon:yes gene_type:complete
MVQLNLIPKPNLNTKLRINSKVILSIKMLQMSNEELQSFIKQEAEKNPLIILKKNKLYNNEVNYDEGKKQSIKEWLYQQSSIFSTSPKTGKIIETFIENLDDSGFCQITSEEVAKISKNSLKDTNNILKKLKGLDPIGIFSQNLEEFLTIQLEKKHIYNNHYKTIINNLDLVATYNLKKLSNLCNLSEEEIKTLIENITKCNPRPLDAMTNSSVQIIKADIILKIINKKLKITMNNNDQYEVLLNKQYLNKIRLQAKLKPGEENQKFIKDYISHTNWLKNNLNKRNKTLLLVAKTIINHQKEYFFSGETKILPLTHKNVSQLLKINESTVSRSVKNKYIKFNNSTFPLNYFFSSKIKNSDNSAKSIKMQIKNIINENVNSKVKLSDQKITNLLNKNGIMISRRTVTKYRISEAIPNSQIRLRKLKN